MRILMVNHFPLEGSGSGTYTKNLAMQLVERGNQVCVVMPENCTTFPRYEGIDLRPVFFTPENGKAPCSDALPFNFPCFTTHPSSSCTFGDLAPHQLDAYMAAFRSALTHAVASFQPDIIHGQHAWILSSLAAQTGVPLVVTAHGTDLMGCEQWPSLRVYAKAALDACQRVICISRDNESLVRSMFPAQADKVVFMRNGYNPAIFFPQKSDTAAADTAQTLASYAIPYHNEPIVLFAGKLTDFKGVDVLLDAAALYEQQLPRVVTILAGDGQLRTVLEQQAARLGLVGAYFVGNVSQHDLCALYNSATISVVPSRREPFGLVAVEAMACGVPVVATNEGGLPDFVNDYVGALVPVDDAAALAQAVLHTLARAQAHPSWRKDVATYASSHYSQAVIIRELESLYSSVCQSE